MASRIMHSSRTSICARSNLLSHASHLQFRICATRRARGLASSVPTHDPKSDTVWIIGSTLVFGPALIYLLGPGSSRSVTGHGDAHVDPHLAKRGAAPAPVRLADDGIPSHEKAEVEPNAEGEDEAVSDQEDGDSLPETEVKIAAAETTSDTTRTAEGGDTSQNKEVYNIDVKRSSQGEFKDAIQQGVQLNTATTAKVEGEQQNS